jgi:hypothetical protein
MRKYSRNGFGEVLFEEMSVGYTKHKELKANDWKLHRKEYFIITPFIDWWNSFSLTHRLTILGLIIAPLTAIAVKVIDEHFESEYIELNQELKILKHEVDSLTTKLDTVNHPLSLSSDSIQILKNEVEGLSQKMLLKTTSRNQTSD